MLKVKYTWNLGLTLHFFSNHDCFFPEGGELVGDLSSINKKT